MSKEYLSSSSIAILLCLFSCFPLHGSARSCDYPAWLTRHMKIIQCKSDDVELGVRRLSFGSSFSWQFVPSQANERGYWCAMTIFNVYLQRNDGGRCHDKCWWSIRPQGGYFYNECEGKFELMRKWFSSS